MAPNHTMRAALLALLLRPTQAQFSNWADNQINTTICTWAEPRGNIIISILLAPQTVADSKI